MESINKQDAIDVIKALPRWILNPKGEFQPVDPPTKAMIDPDDAIEAIENLPSAQPERKTGRWIIHENADIVDGYYVPKYECSYCHAWKNDDSDFCPDCGADMRGEQE